MDEHFGHAQNLTEFRKVIESKSNTFRELPTNRWKGIETDSQVMQALQLEKAPIGGYVEDFDIDFLRFKVPPNEQDCLIPQQLMMMKVADNAAKDAGLEIGSNVAVLVAMGVELELHQYRGRVNLTTQIETSLKEQGIELTSEQQTELTNIAKDGVAFAAQLNQYTSFIGNIMASRISALWDFSGPAFTLSAEENSVYRCVELAQNLFQTSDIDAVIIASVDLAGSAENITLRQHYGPVSKAGNADKNHWLVGEGAGAFVVKPQSKVNAQNTYATIDGIGFAAGVDENAVRIAAQKALKAANVSASEISTVEAHASGFIAEDNAEQAAFNSLYAVQVANNKVSSVKSHVGHTFNASGVASIIKSALVLDMQGSSHIAISGLGRDATSAHLVLSGTNTPYQSSAVAPVKKRPQLIKKISLGGQRISDSITSHDSPVIAQIKQESYY